MNKLFIVLSIITFILSIRAGGGGIFNGTDLLIVALFVIGKVGFENWEDILY